MSRLPLSAAILAVTLSTAFAIEGTMLHPTVGCVTEADHRIYRSIDDRNILLKFLIEKGDQCTVFKVGETVIYVRDDAPLGLVRVRPRDIFKGYLIYRSTVSSFQ